MTGRIGRIAVVAALAVCLATGAQAQEVVRRDDAGGWNISYPAGWVVLVGAPLMIGTEAAMLPAVQRGAAMPEGGIAVGVFPGMVLEALGLPRSEAVVDMVVALADQFTGERGDLEPLADWPLPAYRIAVDAGAPGDTYAIAAKTPAGPLLGFIVTAADIAAALPIVRAIAASYATD